MVIVHGAAHASQQQAVSVAEAETRVMAMTTKATTTASILLACLHRHWINFSHAPSTNATVFGTWTAFGSA